MIDWLNFVIWVVFMFAGIVLFFKMLSLNKYEDYPAIAVLIIILVAVTTSSYWNVSFNPDLHECTEWECTLGDFLIQDNQNGNWHCSFYDEGIYDTGLRVSHITSEKEPISNCVSFREKTECEKGNTEYKVVRGDGYFSYDVINEFGGEKNFIRNYNKRHPSKIIKIWHIDEYQGIGAEFCTKKSVEELEADYCKENPESDKCYCLEEIKESDGWSVCYPDKTGKFDFSKNLSNCEEQFKEYCVSAVPISEKLYCDENPADAEFCSCIEVIDFPKLVATPNTDMQLVSCSYDNNDSSYFCEGFINQSRFASDDYCLYHPTDSSCITNLSIKFIEKCVRAEPKVIK